GAALVFQDQLAPRLGTAPPSAAAVSTETTGVLNTFTPDELARVEIAQGADKVVLERGPKGWTLPGGWPARAPEVHDLLNLVTGLHSRFVPVTLAGDLKPYGLDDSQHPIRVTVTTQNNTTYALLFGEPPADSGDNPFLRPTYVR